MKKDILMLTVVLAFVVLLGVYFLAVPRTELAYVPIEVDEGEIVVTDQPDLDHVVLDRVVVSDGSFVTVHESLTAGGGVSAPAAIIGISDYLTPGIHENVDIALTQEMLPGFPYITLLHLDDGDEIYVTENDLPAMVNGEVVRPSFTAAPETSDEDEDVEDGEETESEEGDGEEDDSEE